MSFRSFVKTRSGAGPALLPRPPSRSLLARVIAGFAAGCPLLATAGSSPLPDLSYGGASDGIARVDFGFAGRSDDSARAGLVLAGDRLLVAGIVAIGEAQGDIGFARLDAGGRLDADFGAAHDGRAPLGFVDAPALYRIARAGDATLFVGGTFDFSSMLIGRLDRDGAIDTSFNGAGFRHLGGGFFLNGGVAALATGVSRLSNGKILVSGVAGSVAMTCFALARLNADGSTDTSFGGGQGRTCVAPALPDGRPFAYSSS
ncbi:delta-60 repeat domain-containing protein, partial [Dokdonella sp.]|uniref:delta-60 repeat domain-containing protein n=1 Tax=Dokdonella sp. TaxID=2291710 RepID=UPI002617D1AB